MTNEQREAIEICKKKIIEPFYDFPNPTSIELKDTDVRAIEIALSLIKEQQEEIERLRYIKKIFDYVVQKETERKDKQIDLMAERIEWLCKSNGILLDKEHDENFTQEDVKQYFERKVEEC